MAETELDADREAWFTPLAQDLSAPAYHFALWLVRDSSTAEEIVQEALMRSWRSGRTPRERDDFQRWLYRLVSNLARDHRRRDLVRRGLRLAPPRDVDVVAEVERRAADAELARAVSTLSAGDRQIVYLRFFEGLGHAEIGRIIGRREGSVRVATHRALGRLRGRLLASGGAVEVLG